MITRTFKTAHLVRDDGEEFIILAKNLADFMCTAIENGWIIESVCFEEEKYCMEEEKFFSNASRKE